MIYNYKVSLTPPRAVGRPAIDRLERAIAEQLDQVDCPTLMHYAPGVVVRDMEIPQGVTAVGCIHKTEHIAIVTKGRIAIYTGDGEATVYEAGDVIVSPPGVKRAAYALEDARIVNVHPNPTNTQDMNVLCEMFVETTAEQLLGGTHNKQLEHQRLRALTMKE